MIANYSDIFKLILRLSWRNIWRQKKRSFVVLSSAAAGIMGLLFSLASINGFSESMVKSAIESGIGHVQIRPSGYEKSRDNSLMLKDIEGLQRRLASFKDIPYSFRLEREAILRSGNISQGVALLGIDPPGETLVSAYESWMIQGSFFKETVPGAAYCIIGSVNADRMELEENDYVILTITDSKKNLKAFRCAVAGIFKSPSEPVDKYTVLITRGELSNLYFGSDSISAASYAVFLGKNMKFADDYSRQIENSIGSDNDFILMTWKILEPGFMRFTELMDSFYWIFYSIIMFGFAFALFESVTMSVFERTREIGVLTAIGTGPWVIFLMVIVESVFLAFMGSLIGTLLGWTVTLYFQFNGFSLSAFAKGMESYGRAGSTLFPFLKMSDILSGIEVTVMVSFFSAIYPAIKAVRMTPIKAIYNR